MFPLLIAYEIFVCRVAKSAVAAMEMGPSVAVAAPSSLLIPFSEWQPTMANSGLGKDNIRLIF